MTITVISQGEGGLRQKVELEGFEDLYVDAPGVVGGDESAPDPHDYFDLSLAACKAITAQMYAYRKGWPLTGVKVWVVRDERDERHGVYRLDVSMHFEGIDDATQLDRLTEISDRCPIHRLMTTSTVDITTRQVLSDQD
ncbi:MULTISPECIES: OsmC family protein [Halomonadaceae]|jgi:putative redox protein|uniref:OsmC family protein n=1 Tax=Halomonadaceae TaxID=28256 RepID=UPI0015840746|nr:MULTISPECIES: OsmC family protein [Halomonas]MDI4638480.1 OsmC family protein [Halomonas sp. BMC7]NUJ59467.1 OsmC family protein [Halomonas taeanensis]